MIGSEQKVYLIDGPPMRYDLNLFQSILNLMEVMCLVQEEEKCMIGVIANGCKN